MTEILPLERVYDLGRLSEAGDEIVISPGPDELVALAAWAEVASIERFVATIDLTRTSIGRFQYEAKIEADLTQECVVTLEPVKAHIETQFNRELHLTRVGRHTIPDTQILAVGTGDDDAPELINTPHFDLAGPLLEEFSLAIDPYPRAPGAAFESVDDPDGRPENPFAVLKSLKTAP